MPQPSNLPFLWASVVKRLELVGRQALLCRDTAVP